MYIECEKCKYNYDGECDFYSMGSGNEIDMPCYQEKEPCEDCISRQAVLDLIKHYNSDGLGSVFYGYEEGVKFADAVNKLPSIVPIPNNATNGDVIKSIVGEDFGKGAGVFDYDLMICDGEYYLAFNVDWWNAPYKRN